MKSQELKKRKKLQVQSPVKPGDQRSDVNLKKNFNFKIEKSYEQPEDE